MRSLVNRIWPRRLCQPSQEVGLDIFSAFFGPGGMEQIFAQMAQGGGMGGPMGGGMHFASFGTPIPLLLHGAGLAPTGNAYVPALSRT